MQLQTSRRRSVAMARKAAPVMRVAVPYSSSCARASLRPWDLQQAWMSRSVPA